MTDVALVRVESLCPFPVQAIRDELAKYANAREFVWSQEEHRNMGAWTFVQPRFENMCERRVSEEGTGTNCLAGINHLWSSFLFFLQIQYRGRPEAATVAVGVSKWHVREAEDVIKTTLY